MSGLAAADQMKVTLLVKRIEAIRSDPDADVQDALDFFSYAEDVLGVSRS